MRTKTKGHAQRRLRIYSANWTRVEGVGSQREGRALRRALCPGWKERSDLGTWAPPQACGS